jgi:hypothetical protein
MQMKKPLLTIVALALFAFYNYALVRWIQSGHNFNDVWQAATSDWFLAVTVFDMSLFSLLCLIWLYRDMSKRHMGTAKKLRLLLLTLITGVVIPLLYLAYRKNNDSEKP